MAAPPACGSAGCGLDRPFVGVTLPGTCQTAFQNPTPGKWEFRTEPGSFRLGNVESGETLRFRKVKSLSK